MKSNVLKILSAALLLSATLPLSVGSVFANSGPMVEYGITGVGVFTRNEKSVLAVESEKLTFDICDFPQIYDGFCGEDYNSTVTAEYKFVNTSAETVRTTMAFPAGNVPYYFSSDFEEGGTYKKPTITVNGAETETDIRFTYGNYGDYTDFADGVVNISDELYEDEFYKPDLSVTKYTVRVDRGNYSQIVVEGKVTSDNGKARYMCGNGFGNIMNFYFYENAPSYESLVENGQYVFYVLGDKTQFSVEWTVMEEIFHPGTLFTGSRTERREVDIPVEVTEVTNKDGTPAFDNLKALVLSGRQKGSVVGDADYYNALSKYALRECEEDDAYACDHRYLSCSDDNFCAWYLYDVEVGPLSSFVNKVCAPIYPTVYMNYVPCVYGYEYYLSPAKGWKDFGSLEVTLNVGDYYLQDELEGFEKTADGVYKAEFSSLPDKEIEFSLSSSESPEVSRHVGITTALSAIFAYVLLGIGVIVPFIVGLVLMIVLLVKRKKTHGN